MAKYRTFDLAIQDGDGQVRYVVPCSMNKGQTIDEDFVRAAKDFGAMKLFDQGFETYQSRTWLENQDESDEIGEYHYDGSRFEAV